MAKGKDGADKTKHGSHDHLVAHVDMDAFYASVEILDDPTLAQKPVVVGGNSNRSVVSAASYAARTYGVRSAMPMVRARQLCPGLVILPVRMDRYKEVSRQVMEVLEGFTPVVEQVSVDEAYLDLTGTSRIWGDAAQTGMAIKAQVKEQTSLNCSVGLAPLRYLAKIASDRDKPDGLTVVDDVEKFLQSITLAEVPGIGKKAQERLGSMGIRRLVELRAFDQKQVERLFGAWGVRMLELAWGHDETPIGHGRPLKSISHELTLGRDTADRRHLEACLLEMGHKVAARLRAKQMAGRVVTLKLKPATMPSSPAAPAWITPLTTVRLSWPPPSNCWPLTAIRGLIGSLVWASANWGRQAAARPNYSAAPNPAGPRPWAKPKTKCGGDSAPRA